MKVEVLEDLVAAAVAFAICFRSPVSCWKKKGKEKKFNKMVLNDRETEDEKHRQINGLIGLTCRQVDLERRNKTRINPESFVSNKTSKKKRDLREDRKSLDGTTC